MGWPEHGQKFVQFYSYVHVLVKLGRRCGSRCTLLNDTVS